MNVTWSSILTSTMANGILDIDRNEMRTQRWILGMIVGSIPFLLIVICWIFVSLFRNCLIGYYRCERHRQRDIKTNTKVNNNITQMTSP